MSTVDQEQHRQERAGAPQGAPPALPCLYGNNSDKDEYHPADHIQRVTQADRARHRKTASALAANVEHFVSTFGLDRCGFLTITFAKEVKDPKEAQRRFNNYARRVLGRLFADRIRVLEPHMDGRPHYHLVVACEGDIRTGFNWEHYDAVRNWSRGGREGAKPRGNLNRSQLLAELHAELNRTGPRYGVGRMELTPIRSNEEAVGRYVGGYISKGSLWRHAAYKGARWVNYSRGFDRKVKGGFSWVEKGRDWRLLVKLWAEFHGCADLGEVKALFGPRWAHMYGESIRKQSWVERLRKHPEQDGLAEVLRRRTVEAARAIDVDGQASEDTPRGGDSGRRAEVHVPPEPRPAEGESRRWGAAAPGASSSRRYHLPSDFSDWRFKSRVPRITEQREFISKLCSSRRNALLRLESSE